MTDEEILLDLVYESIRIVVAKRAAEGQTMWEPLDVDTLAYDAIKARYGEEHASAVPRWYAGEEVAASDVLSTIKEIVDNYGKLG